MASDNISDLQMATRDGIVEALSQLELGRINGDRAHRILARLRASSASIIQLEAQKTDRLMGFMIGDHDRPVTLQHPPVPTPPPSPQSPS